MPSVLARNVAFLPNYLDVPKKRYMEVAFKWGRYEKLKKEKRYKKGKENRGVIFR